MPPNDFKLTFTLKQHTPIIHFQHDQTGATLRATELKPKLDRFLIEKFKKDGVDYKPFLIAGQDGALDYKVRVESIDTQTFPIEYHKKRRDNDQYIAHYDRQGNKVTTTLPTFFANMGDDWKKNPKNLVLSDTLKIVVTAFNLDLLEKIKSHFQEFIFVTTFGMRQSKGFGSFTLEKINDENIPFQEFGSYKFTVNINKAISEHIKAKNNKYVEIPNDTFIKYFELFESIHRFHQTLRSGINERLYFKPWIFYYAMDNHIQWDKKTLKQQFLGNQCLQEQIDKHKPAQNEPLSYDDGRNNHWLIRDLFGLSTEQVWRAKPKNSNKCYYGFTVRHPKEKNGKGVDEFKGKTISPNEIKRFKSPITYKPVKTGDKKYTIYIILSNIPQELFSQNFTIVKDKNGAKDVLQDMRMWNSFDLENFFQYIVNNKNTLKNKFKKVNLNESLYEKITTIYDTLERILNAAN